MALNNRPLSYLEDDIQFPVLIPNTFLFEQPNLLPELEPYHIEDGDIRKRAKYLGRCKEAVWKRWTSEYLRGLRERHRLKHGGKQADIKVGEVVIIKSEQKNRGKWKIGVERPIQHLYQLELTCDREKEEPTTALNVEAPEFAPRRTAAIEARDRIP